MFNNKLQVVASLIKRVWQGKETCCLCDEQETVNHMFFKYVMARLIWVSIKEVFHLSNIPRSRQEFYENWLQGKGPLPKRLIMFLFAGFTWALWTARNKMAIQKASFPKAPTDVVYCLIIDAEEEHSARGGLGAFAVHEGGDRPVPEII